jgi:uncharacterized protein YqeY
MRTRLRQALTAAIKARDRTTTRALRSALSAIENAEATEVIHDPRVATGSEYIAGSTAGLGAAEVERRVLSDSDVHALVQAQVDERLLAAEEYERCRRGDLASQFRAEADVLRQYLHPSQ